MELTLDAGYTLNVQAVEVRTGVTAETLRTWERRYGWPRPRRLPNGYRLYSEADVSLILAVKKQVQVGLPASAAWQHVLREAAQLAEQSAREWRPDQVGEVLHEALLSFDQDAAAKAIAEAHAGYPLEHVLLDIFSSVLVDIGRLWNEGQVNIAQEHFASNVIRDNIVSLAHFYHAHPGAPTIMIGSAPGDLHDIGVLMLSLLLKRRGHRVIFVGQSIGLDQLQETLEHLRPRLLLLSASRLESARALCAVAPLLAEMPGPRPLFAFGGRAFEGNLEAALSIGGTYIAGDAVQALTRIDELLAGGPRA